MAVDLSTAMGDVLGDGFETDVHDVIRTFADERRRFANHTEHEFGRAGWYGRDATPYPEQATDIDAPPPADRPEVESVRDLWLARFNPASEEWVDADTGESGSDVADEALFPWSRPEAAASEGNFWLSTVNTPKNRTAIEAIEIGDLVVIQRSDPKKRPDLRGGYGASNVLIGIAIAAAAEEWDDADTGRAERQVSLLPASRFKWDVARSTANARGRLKGGSFTRMAQRQDGSGSLGFTLSAIIGDREVNDIIAVCGLHPDILSEPDLAVVAARLRATAHGNEPLWRSRYDHVYRHAVRTTNERAAVARCRVWAQASGYAFRHSAEFTANAGYDLLFVDLQGRFLQVEVKGYRSRTLAAVRLQPSQARRASEAANGAPPSWKLFAVLGVDGAKPIEHVKSAKEIVELINNAGIRVKGVTG